jgi:sensor histidine kinase regulating citrate/malate metabolism
MKISVRISLIVSVISIITIVILTVLMHFRYNLTRTNLINDRIAVTANSIISTVDTNLKKGLSIESQSDLQNYIKKKKESEKIIDNIYILKYARSTLTTVFKSNQNEPPSTALIKSYQKMNSTKSTNWNFSEIANGTKMNYVGFTLKGATGLDVGVVLIDYDSLTLDKQEKDEIYNLYERMLFAILISIILSVLTGYATTKRLEKTISTLDTSLERMKNNEKHFDLSGISEPTLKGEFRKAITYSSKVTNSLNKIDELLISAKEEDAHE